jgi:hypothetical protein
MRIKAQSGCIAGKLEKKASNAASPPADAPIPMMGKAFAVLMLLVLFDGILRFLFEVIDVIPWII